MRFARCFGKSAGFWLLLQVRYALEIVEQELSNRSAFQCLELCF